MVITCINRFSKIVQLVPLQESDASTIADKFLSTVLSQHRLPECITSDCDPYFHGHFWDKLMSLLDMTLTLVQLHTLRLMEQLGNKPYYGIAITDTCEIEKLGEEITTHSYAHNM